MEFIDVLSAIGVLCIPIAIGATVAWRGARREVRLLQDLLERFAPDLRESARRAGAELRAGGAALGAGSVAAERIEHVERAVETIAVEMERLAEGQRFVARVLTERQDAATRAAGLDVPRSVTPH